MLKTISQNVGTVGTKYKYECTKDVQISASQSQLHRVLPTVKGSAILGLQTGT